MAKRRKKKFRLKKKTKKMLLWAGGILAGFWVLNQASPAPAAGSGDDALSGGPFGAEIV